MKVDVVNHYIDKSKLEATIRNFKIINNKNPDLVMSSKTSDKIIDNINWEYKPDPFSIEEAKVKYGKGILGVYTSCKIFYDESLEFGVIDVR